MNTCKNCKWWGNNSRNRKDHYHLRDFNNGTFCGSPKTHFAETHTTRLKEGYDKDCFESILIDEETEEKIDTDNMSCLDGSGYWGAIFTGPEFGCVNFEEKR